MNSRERVRRTLTFQKPDRVPFDLWMLGTIPKRHKAELDAVLARFPSDFVYAPIAFGKSQRARNIVGEIGQHTDEWGCVFEVLEEGVHGEVRNPILADWSALATLTPPNEILEGLDVTPSHAFYEKTDKFILCGSTVQPFQRILFLRGFENLMLDFATEPPELFRLLEMVHQFYLRELHLLAPAAADAITFKDDWGSQERLLISPRQWRRYFKPMYAEYCRIIHKAGKFAFFHSDGEISSIYPDLVEIGIDAINSQLFCMDIEGLAARYKGKITFWGEIDRVHALAFGTPAEVRAAVRRVRRALDDGQGGVIAQCEWGNDTPRANVEAVFEAWQEPLDGH
ncbi:MAG: methyltransferase [Anaerolineae bacterium]|nr:methyltransferase [Anaerolineae bacterium]